MKTLDIFTRPSVKKLNESFEKTFGKKLNLESFTLPQLEDARNRLRTKIHQMRNDSTFNETVENEDHQKTQWMLDIINQEIAERTEDVVEEQDPAAMFQGIETESDSGDPMISDMSDEELAEFIGADADWVSANREDAEGMAADMNSDYQGEEDPESSGSDDDESFGIYDGYDFSQQEQFGESMNTQVNENELNKASAVVSAKGMVDKVSRWIEELAGIENDTLLSLGDSIRDEMGQEQAKAFLSQVAPAIQSALDTLKQARETMSTGVRALTGEVQPAEMLGSTGEEAPPGFEEPGVEPAEPDAMNADELEAPEDDFAAAEPAAGGSETAGREQRESINFQSRLLKALAG